MIKNRLNGKIRIDFVSTSFTTTVELKYIEILKILNLDDKVALFNCVIKDIVKPNLKVIDYFGGDFIGLIPQIPYFWKKNIIDKNKYKDNFGVIWEKTGIYYEKVFYLLKNILKIYSMAKEFKNKTNKNYKYILEGQIR